MLTVQAERALFEHDGGYPHPPFSSLPRPPAVHILAINDANG